MFAKNKKTAILMAFVFMVPVIAIAFVVGEIRYSLRAPEEQNPNVVNGFAGMVPALMALAILLLSLVIASVVIYHLNESHYGRKGIIHWAIMGIIYGLLQQVVLTPIPSNFDFQVVSILKQIGGDLLWKVSTLALSYFLAFPLFSLVRKWLASSHKVNDSQDKRQANADLIRRTRKS